MNNLTLSILVSLVLTILFNSFVCVSSGLPDALCLLGLCL